MTPVTTPASTVQTTVTTTQTSTTPAGSLNVTNTVYPETSNNTTKLVVHDGPDNVTDAVKVKKEKVTPVIVTVVSKKETVLENHDDTEDGEDDSWEDWSEEKDITKEDPGVDDGLEEHVAANHTTPSLLHIIRQSHQTLGLLGHDHRQSTTSPVPALLTSPVPSSTAVTTTSTTEAIPTTTLVTISSTQSQVALSLSNLTQISYNLNSGKLLIFFN